MLLNSLLMNLVTIEIIKTITIEKFKQKFSDKSLIGDSDFVNLSAHAIYSVTI